MVARIGNKVQVSGDLWHEYQVTSDSDIYEPIHAYSPLL